MAFSAVVMLLLVTGQLIHILILSDLNELETYFSLLIGLVISEGEMIAVTFLIHVT